MTQEEDTLKELGLVVATKEQELWVRVKEATEKVIKTLEDDLTINRAMLEMAKTKCN